MPSRARKSTTSKAAEVPPRRGCGAMEVHYRLLISDTRYADARVQIENHMFSVMSSRGFTGRSGVTVIPTVVHVVHGNDTENISDAQIQSQIDILNADFRKTNADVAGVPAVFAPLAADSRIEFELATTDPSGGATNGITRRRTTVSGFTHDDKVKSAAQGGTDAWPADKYLNIWVCQLGGGLLGYAQFPGGAAATDGVVCLHSAFGNTGTATAPFNKGRTATHEVGHWLDLRHIWGDDSAGCNGSDFVDDTPNCAGPNYGEPTFPVITCSNGPNGDMFMNYMDYTDDTAMFMFTGGQVTRMQATLDGVRSTLGYTKPGPPATLKFRDDNITLKFRDDGGSMKFRDDPITLKFRDDPVTLKFRDDGGPNTSPRIDVIKQPALDKPPFADQPMKPPVADMPMPPFDPSDPTPFVLATGHHSNAWRQSFPEAAAAEADQQLSDYETLLSHYEEAATAGTLSDAETAEANRVYQEYVALASQVQPGG